jgi:hypothetical protein
LSASGVDPLNVDPSIVTAMGTTCRGEEVLPTASLSVWT